MFRPPRCPYSRCPQHRRPEGRFYYRYGYYHPESRAHEVQRYLCRTCRRTFSRQTFRVDFRDRRPDLNAPLYRLLNSGVGLRQSARLIGLSRCCTELKFRKLAAHCRDLNLNLRGQLRKGHSFQFDEFETYEGRRNTRPLTVPVLIERDSRFVLWAESASIRPRGSMTEARQRAIAQEEKRLGRRIDQSRAAIRRTLKKGADCAGALLFILLETDEKKSYPSHARWAFPDQRIEHRTTNSKAPRTPWNPLFPINHTEARLRDLMGRLRRESWLVSKKRERLDLHLQLHMTWLNYHRPRFNRDQKSPAELLGWTPRRLTEGEVMGWRQDWGERSIHPLSKDGRTEVGAALRAV